MTTRHAPHPDGDAQGTRRRRAVVTTAITAGLLTVGLAIAGPAEAAVWRRPAPTTTTTKAPATTTTTKAPVTTTTTAPPAAAPGTCGGTVLKKADGSSYQCSFDDEFDGTSLDTSKWVPTETAANGFVAGTSCYLNSTNNVKVASGVLALTVRKEAAPFVCKDPVHGSFTTQVSTGGVSTYNKFSQTYGRFEVRAKLPAAKVKGLQTSFWMWPDNPLKYGPWPTSGELDIAEWYSAVADRAIPYLHYLPKAVDYNVTNNYCLVNDVTQFHTYTAEWTPTTITITFDGVVCIKDTIIPAAPLQPGQPFDHPFMVSMQTGYGIGTNAPTTSTPLPAVTQVDYVRVWK